MSITLTRDQAERCMREDAEFKVKWRGNVYTFSNGNVCRWDDASIAWVKASDWEAIGPWLVAPVVMVHSDPQGTYNELFGKTDMDPKAFRTETEQKYLTRPEALKALIRGERILATDDLNTELWLDGDVICSTLPGGHIATFQLFFTCDKYTLVPQPDSPEKFVREFHATCPSGPLPQHWEDFIQKFFKRSDDLIQQMDKEVEG